MTEETGHGLGIDWLKTTAGALAAVSSAVLLSTLGAAGTIIGAALGSVVATVGGALYSQGLARSRQRMVLATSVARRKVGIAEAEVRRASQEPGNAGVDEAELTKAVEHLDEIQHDLETVADEPVPSWRDRFATLPWKHIWLVAAGLFAAAVLAITGFELAVGRTVSSMTGGTHGGGGTTISHIGGGGHHSHHSPSPSPSDQASPTDGGTVGSSPQPSHSPTPGPTRSTPTSPLPATAPTTSVPTTTSATPTPAPSS